MAVYMYSVVHKSQPYYIKEYLELSNRPNATRSVANRELAIPKPRTESLRRTVVYRGITKWNSLSLNLRNSTSKESLKKLYSM